MNILRSLIFYILFIFISLLSLPHFLIAGYIIRDAMLIRKLAHVWVYYLLLLARKILGISYEFKNVELIKKMNKPCIIASKHQSMWEAFSFFHEFGDSSIGVMKKQLEYFPIINIIAPAIKNISVDRKEGLKTLHNLLKESEKRIKEGYHICIFPEGTRTAVGVAGDYKQGLYLLYKHLKVPVITVALNSGLFWPPKTFTKKPGCITAEVTGIIDPGLSQDAFQQKIIEMIEVPSQKLSSNR